MEPDFPVQHPSWEHIILWVGKYSPCQAESIAKAHWLAVLTGGFDHYHSAGLATDTSAHSSSLTYRSKRLEKWCWFNLKFYWNIAAFKNQILCHFFLSLLLPHVKNEKMLIPVLRKWNMVTPQQQKQRGYLIFWRTLIKADRRRIFLLCVMSKIKCCTLGQWDELMLYYVIYLAGKIGKNRTLKTLKEA